MSGRRRLGRRWRRLHLLLGLEAFFDQLSDGFGAGWDAVLPSVVVDLLQEPGGYGDDDAGIGLLGFAGHWPIVPLGQHAVNMREMPTA